MPWNASVNGANFRPKETKEIIRTLEVNDTLDLEREPDNLHDEHAIKVLYEGTHIGYIERDVAAFVSPLMRDGQQFTCTIHSFLGDIKPYVVLDEV